MLYRVNDIQWVSLRTLEFITIREGANDKWYLDLYSATTSVYSNDYDTQEEAKMEVLKIHRLMEESVL